MKKKFYNLTGGLFVIILLTNSSYAVSDNYSNIISYDWKITNDSSVQLHNKNINISGWDDINIGVSWERQGYFSASGELIIANQFEVPDIGSDYSGTNFYATINLQCKVIEVYLNGKKIDGKFQFNRTSPPKIEIPANELLFDHKNTIAIRIDRVQWTGGMCANEVRLTHTVFGTPETIKVSTNVDDCLFKKSDDIVLNINHSLNKNSKIKVKTISDFHKLIETKYIRADQPNGGIQVKLKRKLYDPGFYHIIVSTEAPFYTQNDIWIAVEPEKVNCKNSEILDFKTWWDNTIDELNSIPPETKLTKLPGNENLKKVVYELTFNSFDNVLIHGYLFVPQKEGKFPAILHLPGYSQPYNEHSIKNNEDVIELALCIRGHGSSIEKINPGFDLPGYVFHNVNDEKQYVYRGAYMDCLRAVDILHTLPQVDTTRIAVFGASQGGGLSLATAALAGDKVDVCVVLCPFLSDLEHHHEVRKVFNIEKQIAKKAYNCEMAQINKSLNYIDTKNMVSWITASVFYGAGLFDDDCPPHVGFVSFNKITSEKAFRLYPEHGHILYPGYTDGRNFIKEKFGF